MFKVEDLRTGMKVVTKDGEYIVMLRLKHNYNRGKHEDIAVNPNSGTWLWTYDFEELVADAVEIFIPEHPYDIFYNHNGWQSIWKKEPEKTEAQLKIEELQATIEKAQQQIEQLKEMK